MISHNYSQYIAVTVDILLFEFHHSHCKVASNNVTFDQFIAALGCIAFMKDIWWCKMYSVSQIDNVKDGI